MSNLPRDLREALRALSRSPGFTLIAVTILALGLGVNAILFNTVNALLWRPLGFPQAERLVTLRTVLSNEAPSSLVSVSRAVALQENAEGLAEVGIVDSNSGEIQFQGGGSAKGLAWAQVNSGYLRALGLLPVAGRFFGDEEDREGDFYSDLKKARHQAPELHGLLTEAAWRSRFGADPGVVGRVLPLEKGRSLRILGIVPGGATLPFAEEAEVLLALPWLHPELRDNKHTSNYFNILRMKADTGLMRLSEQTQVVLNPAGGDTHPPRRFWIEPLRNALVPKDRRPILLVAAAAGLLLMLTCANVASLFLVRTLGRGADVALRLALGASPGQAARLAFMEALLVCVTGSVLALWINHAARPLVLLFLPELTKVGAELLDTGRVLLAFSLVVSLLITFLIGYLSYLQSRKTSLTATLSQGTMRGSAPGRGWQKVLISTQVAVIVVLLTMGGLAWRSLSSALNSEGDLQMKGVMAVSFSLPEGNQTNRSLVQDWTDRVSHLPGTHGLCVAEMIPCGGSSSRSSFSAEKNDPSITLFARQGIGAGYFDTLRTPLLVGRELTREEELHGDNVVIVNESAARHLLPAGDPLGRQVYQGARVFTVIGVVRDSRFKAMDQAPEPMLYFPWGIQGNPSRSMLVRTSATPAAFALALHQLAADEKLGVGVRSVHPLSFYARQSIEARTHSSILVGGFALVALLVGSVGLYGTLAGQVHQQRKELGIRMALGSSRTQIVSRMLTQGLGWVLPGALGGLLASMVAARAVRHVFYGVGPVDGPAFITVFCLLFVATLMACLIPALRAAQVHPAEALRSE